jgi:hypothetical protein
MTYYRPVFVSEDKDPDGLIQDCVWCSGLMQANAASGGKHPATLAEAEALRKESGAPMTGGSTSAQLITGTTRRYGFAATNLQSPAALLAALKPGVNATVDGNPANCPVPFQRFCVNCNLGHRVFVSVEAGPTYWLMDPLAPPGSGYTGQKVTLAQITAFAQNRAGGTVAPTHVIPAPVAGTNLFPGGKLYRLPVVAGSLTVGYSNAPAFRASFVSATIAGATTNPWWKCTSGTYSGYYVPRGVLTP